MRKSSVRTALTWTAVIILIPMVLAIPQGWLGAAAEQLGWYDGAGRGVEQVMTVIRTYSLAPWVLGPAALLVGVCVGMWLEALLRSRSSVTFAHDVEAIDMPAPAVAVPADWASGLSNIKLSDAAAAFAGVTPDALKATPRAKTIHTELMNDVREGWVPLASEVTEKEARTITVWPEKFPIKTSVNPNAVVPVEALRGRYDDRGWQTDWLAEP